MKRFCPEPQHGKELEKFFSQPRLRRYHQIADGDFRKSMQLYEWNLEISSAFQTPLHYCEIAVRNAVADTFCNAYGEAWPSHPGLNRSLNSYSRNLLYDSRKKYDKRISEKIVMDSKITGKIVSELNFVFWEQAFARRWRNFWNDKILATFPNYPENDPDVLRTTLHRRIQNARELRNRIAHHEPIFERQLAQELSMIFDIVYWRSIAAAEWFLSVERVSLLLSQHP